MSAPERHRPVVGTLGYILSPDGAKVLMVHRTYRESDENLGKYNGVGGHLERGEGVAECMKREIREETGLEVVSMRLRGTVCWSDFGPSKTEWLGFVFVVDSFRGEPFADNEEGTLSWVPVDEIGSLPMWKGDRLFLPLVFDSDPRPFHGYMRYEGDEPHDWRFDR
ncbi:MAG: 8-oxo-dGTP diphosphatase [Kiritimatiellae bacterium]|nr:8-oxo-dGTP diphosphatase [Kiritimatiellia bacterium]